MGESRTKNSIFNISSGLLFRLLSLLVNFTSRTVFIKVLGDGCLGLNGLFTSVLSMFSLAELGIGQAITYYMYKPIAEQDEDKLASLIQFYKLCYRIIGMAILLIGLLLIPVLPKLVNLETDTGYNLYLIYILYLINTAISYLFFSYPQTVLSANQKQYITNRVESRFVVISAICEMLFLVLTKNYIAYLLVRIVVAVIKNIILAYKASRLYPYIKKRNASRIESKEIKEMFKDVYAIFIVRISSQLFNSTDNLFISAMFGTVLAGYNSNYLMIINAIYGVISTLIYSFSGSIGNLYATSSKEKTESVFSILDFFNRWVSCFCTVCLFQLLNPFITLVWGEKYTFSMASVALMCASFYIVSSLYTLFGFRQSIGLFQYCIYNQLIAALINIALDFVLGSAIGINGLFLSTVIANVCIAVFPYARNLYQVGFELSSGRYVMKIIFGYLTCVLSCSVTMFLCESIPVTMWGLIVMAMICFITPNLIMFLLYFKTNDFKGMINYSLKVLNNLSKRKGL